MALRLITAFLGLLFTGISFNLNAGSIPTIQPPRLGSAAALVKDQQTGEYLVAKRTEDVMPIASITKLMTAMVVLDARLDLNEPITIKEEDKDRLRHSQSRLWIGTHLTRRDALLLMLMASENRAARALGRTFPGGIPALVDAMNEKAFALGLTDTKFEDPAGLSDGNVSTAQDLSRLVASACCYPLICAYSTQTETTIRSGKRRLNFGNTNTLVHSQRWHIGLSKTGYIHEAGNCLVMQVQLAQRPVLMVLLNSDGKKVRLRDAQRIKQWMERAQFSVKTGRR